MHDFKIPGHQTYRIRNIENIKTPALIIFKKSVLKNLESMKSYLESVSPNSGFKHLCPHVKTNKSSYITKLMLNTGIKSFKCTPNEIPLLISSGAKEIFVAYPLLEQNAKDLAEYMIKYPEINFEIQIASEAHAEILKKVAIQKNITWNYFIDLDVGMHRTGIDASSVFDLYQKLGDGDYFKFVGLHGYDGHNHHSDKKLRFETSLASMTILINLFNQFEQQDINIKKIIAAGSPAFHNDLEILYKALKDRVEIRVSPGTWIFWDSKYDGILPGKFEFAAIVLAQVMDIIENQVTLNLGHKRWASDQGGIDTFSESDLSLKSFSEEHTVLKTTLAKKYKIGDYILIVPRHVCPTINLYENFTLIDQDGHIEQIHVPVDARNR